MDDAARARVAAILASVAVLPGNPQIVVRRNDLAALWTAHAQGHAALLAIHQCAQDQYEAISGPFMTGDGAVDTAAAVDRLLVACAALESVERWALEALDGQVPPDYAELERLRAERDQDAPVLAAADDWLGREPGTGQWLASGMALRAAVERRRASREE